MPNLKTFQHGIFLAYPYHLNDNEECLLLQNLNRSKLLDLSYHSYEKFALDSISIDECKSEFR